MTAEATGDLTIDQLAQRTGMTVRNIRAHQSRGLVPPPEVRGRTGYYSEEHVRRIELIQELQTEGYNLELIRRMLADAGGQTSEVLRFTRALREPFGDEQPEEMDLLELAQRFESTDLQLIGRAQQLGLLRPSGEGRYEVPSPRLLETGTELARIGVPVDEALGLLAELRTQSDAVAALFVRVFVQAVWEPFDRAGRPEERWPEVREALERLKPLASSSLLAVVNISLREAIHDELGRELERLEQRAAEQS